MQNIFSLLITTSKKSVRMEKNGMEKEGTGNMHTLIISGGMLEENFIKEYLDRHSFQKILAADRGLVLCKKLDIIPDLILGDFDSAASDALEYYRSTVPERIRQYPSRKDDTDTELAVSVAIELGSSEITILGATGTRLDHVMGNIQILKKALEHGVKAYLVDSHNRIRMADSTVCISREEQFGKYVSLIPFTEKVSGITLRGFSYPVQDYTLVQGRTVGVSNEITSSQGEIDLKEGLLLVMESKD